VDGWLSCRAQVLGYCCGGIGDFLGCDGSEPSRVTCGALMVAAKALKVIDQFWEYSICSKAGKSVDDGLSASCEPYQMSLSRIALDGYTSELCDIWLLCACRVKQRAE